MNDVEVSPETIAVGIATTPEIALLIVTPEMVTEVVSVV
jgi:hypothetical protein